MNRKNENENTKTRKAKLYWRKKLTKLYGFENDIIEDILAACCPAVCSGERIRDLSMSYLKLLYSKLSPEEKAQLMQKAIGECKKVVSPGKKSK